LGRLQETKRLAEYELNMAASFEVEYVMYVNEEITKLIHDIERPVNKAVLLGRIICSHVDCIAKKEFFHNNGIAHHFRVSHKQEWTQALRSESMNVARKLHEQETRECIEKVFEYRRTEVQYVYFMQISFG
jgi:hypothetical protein